MERPRGKPNEMITIEGLRFQYRRKKAVDPLVRVPELKFETNRKTMLHGESGCGKTTLLNLISGILRPDEGAILVNGRDLSRMTDKARRIFRLNHIGYVLQDFSLIPHLKLIDNIKLPFYINPAFKWKKEHQKRLEQWAIRLKIGDLLNEYPGELSIGEKQRGCLCRALVTRPELILADEPTANLDERNRDVVLGVLDDYLREESATLVMVCHDMSIRSWFAATVSFQEVNHV